MNPFNQVLIRMSADASEMSASLNQLAAAFRMHQREFEISLYKLARRWNRYQMVSSR